MGIWEDLTGVTSQRASEAAAADTYRKQQAATQGITDYGDTFADRFDALSNKFQPYAQGGEAALQQLLAGLGLGGPGSQNAFTSAYQNLPGYQSGLQTGTQAAMRGLNAGPGLGSGAALKALQRFGSDYEGGKIGDYFNRLTGLAGMGQQATGQQVATTGQGLQGQLGTRQSAFQGDMGSAGTIGQGQVAGAQARQGALTNLLAIAGNVAGSALGGGRMPQFNLPGTGPYPLAQR